MDTRTCHACFSVSPSVFHHLSYHQVLLTPDSVDCSGSMPDFTSAIPEVLLNNSPLFKGHDLPRQWYLYEQIR